jgi:hypothetical protein
MDIRDALQSQYLASLEMLEKAIRQCPETLWIDTKPKNKFWHIAFHVLFYTHLYLQPTEEDFTPWEKQSGDIASLSEPPQVFKPYSQAEILEYLVFCQQQVQVQLAAADLDAESGFYWLPFKALEKHIYNIRHIQLHAGELCERMGKVGIDIDWVGKG